MRKLSKPLGSLPKREEGKEQAISTSLTPITASDHHATGKLPGAGTYFCLECGSQLSLREEDRLPECPRCGATDYRRDSIFEPMQEHGEMTSEFSVPVSTEAPAWLEEARAMPTPGNRRLAYRDTERKIRLFPIERGWMRIGRSVTADLRLDDPSVSRRHALIVADPDRPLRVLDDRSLNGVFVNGDLVEWAGLEDGDELTIGRFHLFALEA